MLFHLTGPHVLDIFSKLVNPGKANNHAAVTALNGYSLPKVNLSFAHQKFDQLQQKQGETFLQFVLN